MDRTANIHINLEIGIWPFRRTRTFYGNCTVWHDAKTGRRATTSQESRLSEIWGIIVKGDQSDQLAKYKKLIEQKDHALREAHRVLGMAGGTALGVAMSGSDHPAPDEALMGVFHATNEASTLVFEALSGLEP